MIQADGLWVRLLKKESWSWLSTSKLEQLPNSQFVTGPSQSLLATKAGNVRLQMDPHNVTEAGNVKLGRLTSTGWPQREFRVVIIWRKILRRRRQRRKSTARITLVLTFHPLKSWSGGNPAAKIHSPNFFRSNCPPWNVAFIWRFCSRNPQQVFV